MGITRRHPQAYADCDGEIVPPSPKKMPNLHKAKVLSTAVGAVRELLQKKLETDDEREAQALRVSLEELDVLWEELRGQSEHLARERQRYIDFFQCAPDAYLVTDGNGGIREANSAAGELLQTSSDYLVGKPIAGFIAPEHRRVFRAHLMGLGLGARRPASWTSAVRARDGASTEVSVAVQGMGPGSESPGGFCWLLRPLT
jgi:PAS domain S-box-containing protein